MYKLDFVWSRGIVVCGWCERICSVVFEIGCSSAHYLAIWGLAPTGSTATRELGVVAAVCDGVGWFGLCWVGEVSVRWGFWEVIGR